MNWDQIQGKWTQFKGKAREEWGELTDNEIQEAKGEREQMLGLIQEKYGRTREEAERELSRWQTKLGDDPAYRDDRAL
ncbi:CsbD family protein [Ponticoccus alexandrii]|uniref:CsbD family protein n=1 Tax=Ponticoccus alexandrii TaxID=1943633 RepID=A0ABX7F5M6_9RHOB|nr:CsbD family protein [Ponticoccus alexandrii]ETA52544.1 general stress protein CsbD [Rhodobacteraceae bacterium PD-2]QRF65501.1 CsbD family protein [Ponticoccus alexandrii]